MPGIFLSAGEVSGDLHGAHLARALRASASDLSLFGLGSHRMRQAGVEILDDVTPHSAVGLLEHLPGARAIAQALETAQAALMARKPEVAVLIDYQGANMQLARFARSLGIRTVYYLSPQEWIWGLRGGLGKVGQVTDLLLAVFEKEAEAYRKAGVPVRYVGHPLLDMVPPSSTRATLTRDLSLVATEPVIALFPGSRRMEIDRLLPPMLEACGRILREVPRAQFLLPVATPDLHARVQACRRRFPGVAVQDVADVAGMAIMQLADVVLAASGTAVLEAAVVGTPVVATYRVGPLAALVARCLMKEPYVTLPNIVAGRRVVPELLQGEANGKRLAEEALKILLQPRERTQRVAELAQVRARLGTPGAIARAAEAVLEQLPAPVPH